MRGLYFRSAGALDNLKVEDLPEPEPKDGEVLVKVFAAAINPVDAKNVLGMKGLSNPPRVPGRDFAGRVISGDQQWEGKMVFGTGGDLGFGRDGAHAEYAAIPVEGLVELPPDLGYEKASAIGLGYLTAFAGLVRKGELKKGETVLVTGATGAVGSAAVRIASWKGARTLATVRSSKDIEKLKDVPFVEPIDLESRPLQESVMELTDGKGADLILDAVGGPLFQPCLESLAAGGRQVAITAVGDPNVTLNLLDFYRKGATLMGLNTIKLTIGESAAILRALLPGFKEGLFCAPRMNVIGLDEAIDAYRAIHAGEAREKFVICFEQDAK